jgi:outer membrane protein assembly factor BamB
MRNAAPLTLSVLLAVSSTAPAANNWPEFRGPTGQGHSESDNLPTRWSPSENVVWKVEVPGAGLSSPVIYRDVIYLTTALLDEAGNPTSLRLLAYSSASGKLLWNREIFEVKARQTKHKKNSHASPTPVAENDRIYVHFGPLGTAAVDLNGEEVWKQETLDYQPDHRW